MFRCIIQCLDRACGIANAVCIKDTQAHQTCFPQYARNADTVVAFSRDDAGDVNAVSVLISRIGSIFHKVPATDIVNVSIAVLIFAVVSFLLILPLLVCELRMSEVYSAINNGDPQLTLARVM